MTFVTFEHWLGKIYILIWTRKRRVVQKCTALTTQMLPAFPYSTQRHLLTTDPWVSNLAIAMNEAHLPIVS
jgi:hypothetical protein